MTLSKCLAFLNGTSKSNKNHRVLVMNAMTEIVNKNEIKWTNELGEAIALMGVQEIIAEQSIDSLWQVAASNLLIAMARILPKLVATELLDYFPANTPPHYFVVKTLADFSYKYPVSFLPYLKDILTRALPILAMLKHDNLRWVFAAGIGRWAEAIIVATNDSSNPNIIPVSEFSSSMNTALKHILNEWLLQMASKIRQASAEGIGYMAHIIEKDHMGQILDKLMAAYLKLLKSEFREQLPVITGLSNIIEAVIRNAPDSLSTYLEVLMKTFHENLCMLNRPENDYYQKTKDVYLRCFELLSRAYADKVVTFLLKQVESPTIAIRIGTLEAVRHLVSKLKSELRDYKELIVGGAKLVVKTEDYRGRLEIIKLACEMGKRGYLSKQGGNDLLLVVIRGSSIDQPEIDAFDKKFKQKDGKYPPGTTSPSEIRDEADKILFGFSEANMAQKMDKVFWPFIFESFNVLDTSPSFAILCKVVSDVAKRKKDDKDFLIDFGSQVNLPKAPQILARLILMLNEPFGRNNPGVNILRTLYCLSPLFHEELIDAWAKLLPEMKKYLDDQTNFVQEQWENMVLQFVRNSITAVGDDEWACKLGDAIMQSAHLYTGKHALKKALLSTTGLIIQRTNLKEFVFRAINDLFFLADHNDEEERLGCARGYGQAAAIHTDPVLTHLSTVCKTTIKSAGFFYTLKPNDVTSGAKASALLSYGYATMLIPLKLITARVEVYVIQNILPVLKESKGYPEIKENALKALDLVCKAVHPSRVPDYILKSRDEVIQTILQQIKKTETGPNIHKLRSLGMEAISTLLKLLPRIDAKLQASILENTLFIYGTKAETTQMDDTLLDNLNNMLIALMNTDMVEQTLNDLLLALEVFTKNADARQRERSMNTYVALLKEFAVKISENKPKANGLNNTGRIIGELIPRITETSLVTRKLALDAIYLVLRIHFFLERDGNDLPATIKKLGPLRSDIEATNQVEIFELGKKLASILAESVIAQHLPPLVNTILGTMGDVEINGANGSCIVLNVLIRLRGKELETQSNALIKTMLKNMETYPKEVITTGLLLCVKGLAKHHTAIIYKTLLSEVNTKEVIKSFQTLVTDKDLTVKLLDTLLDIINNGQNYEEKTVPGPTDQVTGKETTLTQLYPSAQPISATNALHEILEISDMAETCKEYYSRLLCSILLRIGSCNGCTHNPPTKEAFLALKNFLTLMKEDDLVKMLQMEKTWDLFVDQEQYPTAVKKIMDLLCIRHPDLIKEHFANSKGFITRTYQGHRIAASCIISVLLKYIKDDRELIHAAVNALLARCGTDEDIKVKIHAIEGLAGISYHPKDQMNKFITPVVGSLLSNFEDKEEKIILESMKSMKEVLLISDDEFVSQSLLNVCVRLKPSFEKQTPEIREASIDLFGVMSRYSNGQIGESIVNTIHANIAVFVLHLLEENESVVKASKRAIRKLVSVLGSKNLIALFDDKQFDENGKVDFEQFAIDFSKVWIKDFPNRVSDLVSQLVLFFKSDWITIIGGAALIAGHILANCGPDLRARTNLRHACSSLVLLLRSQSASVRTKASRVLGLMYDS